MNAKTLFPQFVTISNKLTELVKIISKLIKSDVLLYSFLKVICTRTSTHFQQPCDSNAFMTLRRWSPSHRYLHRFIRYKHSSFPESPLIIELKASLLRLKLACYDNGAFTQEAFLHRVRVQFKCELLYCRNLIRINTQWASRVKFKRASRHLRVPLLNATPRTVITHRSYLRASLQSYLNPVVMFIIGPYQKSTQICLT